ncbi:MAG: precorrin-3B C(17)-methyltransferase [Synechococcus sp.]
MVQQGLVSRPDGGQSTAAEWLAKHWQAERTLLVVGAIGAVTRLIAPLLQGKAHDPAVLVMDPKGTHVVPVLGGHGSGAEQCARELAAALGANPVITGACASDGRLALDEFGTGWGWRRSGTVEQWRTLMQHQGRHQASTVWQSSGQQQWLSDAIHPQVTPVEQGPAQLQIGSQQRDGCQWHPPTLWLGVGCERDTSPSLITRAIENTLAAADLSIEAVAGIASADRKGDEAGLLSITAERGWPLRTFPASALANVSVPNPSEVVLAEMGTPSVSEAAALLAAGRHGVLKQPKAIHRAEGGERGAVTVAIAEASTPFAPQRGALHLVGSGPGDLGLISADARQALTRATVWVGYSLYLDLLEPLRRPDQVRLEGQLTREWERCSAALSLAQQGVSVALISSGDSGIYGMAGLALELWLQQPVQDRPAFQVHPGLSALQLAAARVGAPLMHDFCTVSLSDRLTPWPVIEQRLEAAAAGDFVVALYNPRSKGRDWQLARAQEILLSRRSDTTPVALARQLGRAAEQTTLTTLGSLEPSDVDMLTVVLIGNSSTYCRDGRMVTPRGYPGAALQ